MAIPEHVELLHEGQLVGITITVGPTPELDGLRRGVTGYELVGSMLGERDDRYRV